MGYVQEKDVQVHISNNGNLCLKYPFINKNNDTDFMYIPISDEIFKKLLEIKIKTLPITHCDVCSEIKPVIKIETDSGIIRICENCKNKRN